MYIKYDINSGRILSITRSEKINKVQNMINVDNTELPEDFMETFTFGKYFIRENKIAEKNDFVMPEPPQHDDEINLE